jgi:glutamate racemase
VLAAELPVPVIGVVKPGARAAVKGTRNGHIGVIGTEGTIRSGAYVRAIHDEMPDAIVTAAACPLFVPLVEEGWVDKEATWLVAREYLEPMLRDRIDTLVLGCTHYPLLKRVIGETVGRDVRLIDSAEETALDTSRMLREAGLESDADGAAHRFIASDDPQQFLKLGQRFLGDAIDRVEVRTFG